MYIVPDLRYESYLLESCIKNSILDMGVPKTDEHILVVEAMFLQTWGSTTLGFGGVGGQSMTSAYTIVIGYETAGKYAVYFGGKLAYVVVDPNRRFFEDVFHRCMVKVSGRSIYDKSNPL